MPDRKTMQRAHEARRRGKAPSTQAGEFVRGEIEHVREGKHGARSAKQAIAIGLSKARRASVPLRPPQGGTSRRTRCCAAHDYRVGQGKESTRISGRRARATRRALRREGRLAASRPALARPARAARRRRT